MSGEFLLKDCYDADGNFDMVKSNDNVYKWVRHLELQLMQRMTVEEYDAMKKAYSDSL